MDEEIIFKGEWFLPDNFDNRITGTLIYRPYDEFSELELFGHITNYREFKSFDLILGKTLEGDDITLHRCRVTHFKHSLEKSECEKIYFSKIIVELIFAGALISKVEDLIFQKVQTEIYNFENWVDIEGFSDSTTDYGNEVIFNYLKPKPINFEVCNNIRGEINFSINSNDYTPRKNEHKFTQITKMSFASDEHIHFDTLLKAIYNFRDFLVLALYTHTNPFNIELYSENFSKTYHTIDGELKIPKSIYLYTRQAKKIQRKNPKLYNEILFTYNDIRENFPMIIKKWYENYEIIRDSFNLFFYQFYTTDKYLNILFLNLAQSVESFHYHLYPEKKIIEPSEFKRLRKLIKEQLDTELYLWVSPQVSNNLHLDIRLSELIQTHCNDVLLKYIGDIDIFKKNIKDTRNYHTHFNPDLKHKALQGKDLLDLYIKLRLFLISAFLIESGFSKELVNEMFHKRGYRVFGVNL